MKKYNSKQQTGGYGGCMLIVLMIAAVWLCLTLFGCATQKDGCGTENYKHKFNK